MKTVVLGLFDRQEDAEHVLAQLAHSPLDLDAVQVLNADMAVQRRLSDGAGLPNRRAMRTGLVTGAIAGAGLGFLAGWVGPDGTEALLAGPGPLLAMSAGSLLGAILGAVGGAISESNRLPEAHSALALAGLAEGATMVTVRTENEPTARAIGDLFRAGGSRTLEALDFMQDSSDRGESFRPPAGPETIADPSGPESVSILPEAHTPFAPPWRREAGEGLAAAASGGMLFPQAETEAASESGDPGTRAGLGKMEAGLEDASSLDAPFAPPAAIRHGETVISVDRSTRTVEPREVPVSTARFEPEPIAGRRAQAQPETLGPEAAGVGPLESKPLFADASMSDVEAPSETDPKSKRIRGKRTAKVLPTTPTRPLKSRRDSPPQTGPDEADLERLESVARDLMREIFGGSGGSRKA